MSPWKVILATMVIFGCGVVTGGFLMRTALPPAGAADTSPHLPHATNSPPPWTPANLRPEFLRRLQKQLDLTPAQHEEIAKIMADSQERSWPLWDKIAPQMREELKRVHKEIRQVLTPEQQKRWDELLKAKPRKAEAAAAAAARAAHPVPDSPAPTNTP